MKDTDFCPVCKYYLYLDQDENTLRRICRNCGYQKKDEQGGLILIYLKYDAVNMKFLYICNVCDTQWRSKA